MSAETRPAINAALTPVKLQWGRALMSAETIEAVKSQVRELVGFNGAAL